MEQDFPKRKIPRLKDFDYSLPYAYSVTICTKNKKEYFRNESFCRQIIDCLIAEKNRLGFSVYAYCLMPNHLHLLIKPSNEGKTISRFIGAFKSKTTRLGWQNGVNEKLWQGRFYDHIVRKEEDLKKLALYILNNPVRKGVVTRWEDYQFCGLFEGIT